MVDYSHYYSEDLNLIRMERFQVHHYFGYENESIRYFELLREKLTANDLVIGVLGGSVAEMFAGYAFYAFMEPKALSDLRNVIPELATKNLRIVSLAMGSVKQPQQFFIAAYFLDSLDLVINIDGFNDTQRFDYRPIYPLDFPYLSLRFYDRDTKGTAVAGLGRLGVWTYKIWNKLPLRVPLLSHSSLYFIVWYALHGNLYNLISMLEESCYSAAIVSQRAPGVAGPDLTCILDERIKTWKRYTVLQSDLGSRAKKPMFFFLQPNQYLKCSKPLSEEERRTAFAESMSEGNHEGMMRLKGEVNHLRDSGVRIFDLTGIFQTTRETVYIDDCCHLNSRGNEIMRKEIVRVISQYYRSAD